MKLTLLAAFFCALTTVPVFALDPHVEAVIRIVEGAKGKVEKTEDGQSLKLVDLAVPGAGPHDHRKDDPYDASFFEHLGHITTLESLNVISTKANDEWVKPLGKLTNLKTLRFTNNGKLTDTGMETFAGLTNLESISLAHAHFTDAGAPHLAKLTKLKGLEVGTSSATPQSLVHIAMLPLEYLQLGEGFDSPESIPFIKNLTTLRRLTFTNVQKLSDSDLKVIAGMKQLEQLELGRIELSDPRLAIFQDFAHLKSLRLVPVKEPFAPEIEASLKQLLPGTMLQLK